MANYVLVHGAWGGNQSYELTKRDLEAAGHWAETNAVPYVSYADLSQRAEMAGLLRDAFHRVNKALPESLKLHRFVSLHKEFDPDDGEITRTRKLRRAVVEERYASVIAALYDGSKEIHVKAAVTYESGEVGLVMALIKPAGLAPGNSVAFICGPDIMMRVTADALAALGIPPGQIRVSLERNMRCGAAWCGHCQLGPLLVCRDGPVVGYDRAAALMRVSEL